MDEEKELSIHEAADRLGVHYMTAYRYIRSGRLPAQHRGGAWAVRASDVDAVLSGVTGGAAAPGRGRVNWAGQRARLLDRLVEGDEQGAWTVVEHALSGGAEPADIY